MVSDNTIHLERKKWNLAGNKNHRSKEVNCKKMLNRAWPTFAAKKSKSVGIGGT
jgi:hypothetical protein